MSPLPHLPVRSRTAEQRVVNRNFTSVLILAVALSCTEGATRDVSPLNQQLAGTAESSAYDFTSITNAVELPSGRVLFVDYGDQTVHSVDLVRGHTQRVGRSGDGPAEYRAPKMLLPYKHDSLILLDEARMHAVIIISPTGELVANRQLGSGQGVSSLETFQNAADTLGNLYSWVGLLDNNGGRINVRLDSAGIERLSMATGRRDTSSRISRASYASGIASGPAALTNATQPMRTQTVPFSVMPQWSVLPDGTLAVISPSPFRVEFLGTDRQAKTITLQHTLVKVSDAFRNDWRRRDSLPAGLIDFTSGSAVPRSISLPTSEPDAWPTHLPPYANETVRVSVDGVVWITHYTDDPQVYAISGVTRDGVVVDGMLLPTGARLVGVSRESLLLAQRDEDQLESLQRWPRPDRSKARSNGAQRN